MRSILFSFPYLPNHTALCFFPNSIIVIAADTTNSTIPCAHSFMASSINSGVVPFISFISGAWLLSPVADTVQILQPVHLNRLSRLYFVAKRLAQPYKTARYDTERHLQLRSSRIALLCVTHGFRKAAEKLTIMDTWHVHDVSLEGTHLYGSNYLHIFSVLKFVTDQFPKKISCTTNT